MKALYVVAVLAVLIGGFMLWEKIRAPLPQQDADTFTPAASPSESQELKEPIQVPTNHEPQEHTDPPEDTNAPISSE